MLFRSHEAISAFTKAYPAILPDGGLDHLIEFAKTEFAPLQGRPDFEAFWWPRFCSSASWLIAWEAKRRLEIGSPILAEQSGFIDIDIGGGNMFRLFARADRIEILKDGTVALIDFKTGDPPTQKQINIGLTPQLTLEAAIAKQGGFESLGSRVSRELLYVKLGGKKNGSVIAVKPEEMSLDELIDRHYSHLIAMIDAHWNKKHPFLSRPIAEFARRFGDYDHLARVKEWSRGGEDGGESE